MHYMALRSCFLILVDFYLRPIKAGFLTVKNPNRFATELPLIIYYAIKYEYEILN